MVKSNLTGTEGGLAELHQQISTLEDRLSTVLHQEPKQDDTKTPKAIFGVELVDRLDDTMRAANTACKRLASILSRLEL